MKICFKSKYVIILQRGKMFKNRKMYLYVVFIIILSCAQLLIFKFTPPVVEQDINLNQFDIAVGLVEE